MRTPSALKTRPLSTTEVLNRISPTAKVTYRMLYNWIEHGLVDTATPSNPGSGRRVLVWQEELPKIEVYGRVCSALGRKSVTMEVLFQVKDSFHKGFTDLPGKIRLSWKA